MSKLKYLSHTINIDTIVLCQEQAPAFCAKLVIAQVSMFFFSCYDPALLRLDTEIQYCCHFPGIQGNGVSCLQQESVETIFIMVTLPMTKADFIANQDKYIASVATTAGVVPENVKILSIDEVSTSSRIITARSLLATSVIVQTSVMLALGQQTNIKDQSLLNNNLKVNGLPSGTLVVQYTYTSIANVTPAPLSGGSGAVNASGATESLNVLLGAIVGGTVGSAVLVAVAYLALRLRKRNSARSPPPSLLSLES
jgi:hypothetical protein